MLAMQMEGDRVERLASATGRNFIATIYVNAGQ